MYGTVALGILLPFAGTTLGSAMVFLLKKEINPKLQKLQLIVKGISEKHNKKYQIT